MTLNTVQNPVMKNTVRNLNNNQKELAKNLEKLSSGYQVNTAADDAAGLAISEKMRAQVSGLDQAQDNVAEGANLVQAAEGTMQEVHDMLNRLVELATQAANGTYQQDIDRVAIQQETTALLGEIDRIADTSNFNGNYLFNGALQNGSLLNLNGTSLAGDWVLSGESIAWQYDASGSTVNADDYFVLAGQGLRVIVDETQTGSGDLAYGSEGNDIVLYVSSEDYLKNNQEDVLDAIFSNPNGLYLGTSKPVITFEKEDMTFTCAVSISDQMNWIEGAGLTLQIGDTSAGYNQLTIMLEDMHTTTLGIDTIDMMTQDSANASINKIRNAITTVSTVRGGLGATQNRMETTIGNLITMEENIQAAEGQIRDTDFAEETMKYAKNNVLNQASEAMLAHAKTMPETVLQLLQV